MNPENARIHIFVAQSKSTGVKNLGLSVDQITLLFSEEELDVFLKMLEAGRSEAFGEASIAQKRRLKLADPNSKPLSDL